MKQADRAKLEAFERDVRSWHKRAIGYPVNLSLNYRHLSPFLDFHINNIGDPYMEVLYKSNSHQFEREALAFFARIYKAPRDDFWGYVTSGGTEGNMHGIFAAREMHPDGILYFSEDTHYSIRKIARVLNMPSIMIRSLPNGEIDYADLEETIKVHRERPVIVNANIGTTMKGAIDDTGKIFEILERNGISSYYMHCDAALFGMILPFLNSHSGIDFTHPIGSIAVSGHKFIGSPIPCGVVLARRSAVRKIERQIEYIGSMDTTITGSRSGLAVLILWSAIKERGTIGFAREARACTWNARWLFEQLHEMSYPAMRNEHSNIVMLKRPPDALVHKWQLAVQGQWAHVIVMQHVTRKILGEFLADLK